MGEFLRIYQSSVDPSDVDAVRRLFSDDVKPVFKSCKGCLSMELAVNVEPNAGGLVEGAAISRWESLEAMTEAMSTREVKEAIVRVRELLQQEPVSKILEVLP